MHLIYYIILYHVLSYTYCLYPYICIDNFILTIYIVICNRCPFCRQRFAQRVPFFPPSLDEDEKAD